MPIDPAALRILHYPAPELRAKALPVDSITDEVRAVAARMIELMREARGVGLAAPQVGLPWRLFVTQTPEDVEPRVYVNPQLSPLEAGRDTAEEGCLSLPGVHVEIERPRGIAIEATDLEGARFTMQSETFPARVWQHEFDHLNGVLIIDKMSMLDRLATRKILKELTDAARKAEL